MVDLFNNRRLLEPITNIPPVVAEARCQDQLREHAIGAWFALISLRQTRRGSVSRQRREMIAVPFSKNVHQIDSNLLRLT